MPKKFIFIIIGAVILIFAYNIIGQIFTTLQSGDRLSVATEQLHSLEVKNRELKKRLSEIKSQDFIEQQARDKLGLAKEGETLVIIPDEKINQVLGVAKQVVEPRLPNWQGWLKLFFK